MTALKTYPTMPHSIYLYHCQIGCLLESFSLILVRHTAIFFEHLFYSYKPYTYILQAHNPIDKRTVRVTYVAIQAAIKTSISNTFFFYNIGYHTSKSLTYDLKKSSK